MYWVAFSMTIGARPPSAISCRGWSFYKLCELPAQQHNLQVFFMVRQTPDHDQINDSRKQPEDPKPDHGIAPCHDNESLIVPDWGTVPG